MLIYAMYFTSTFLAIALRVWTLTRVAAAAPARAKKPPQGKGEAAAQEQQKEDVMSEMASALHDAAAAGDREALLVELAHGEDIDGKRYSSGQRDVTALFLAAKHGRQLGGRQRARCLAVRDFAPGMGLRVQSNGASSCHGAL